MNWFPFVDLWTHPPWLPLVGPRLHHSRAAAASKDPRLTGLLDAYLWHDTPRLSATDA